MLDCGVRASFGGVDSAIEAGVCFVCFAFILCCSFGTVMFVVVSCHVLQRAVALLTAIRSWAG